MSLRNLGIAVVLSLIALSAAAQDPSGKWNASVDTPQGAFMFQLEFAVQAGKLSGAMTNEFTGTTPITDGTINGKEIAFKLKFDGPDGAIQVSYHGTVNGDSMTLTSKFEGAPPGGQAPPDVTFTATRAKPAAAAGGA